MVETVLRTLVVAPDVDGRAPPMLGLPLVLADVVVLVGAVPIVDTRGFAGDEVADVLEDVEVSGLRAAAVVLAVVPLVELDDGSTDVRLADVDAVVADLVGLAVSSADEIDLCDALEERTGAVELVVGFLLTEPVTGLTGGLLSPAPVTDRETDDVDGLDVLVVVGRFGGKPAVLTGGAFSFFTTFDLAGLSTSVAISISVFSPFVLSSAVSSAETSVVFAFSTTTSSLLSP